MKTRTMKVRALAVVLLVLLVLQAFAPGAMAVGGLAPALRAMQTIAPAVSTVQDGLALADAIEIQPLAAQPFRWALADDGITVSPSGNYVDFMLAVTENPAGFNSGQVVLNYETAYLTNPRVTPGDMTHFMFFTAAPTHGGTNPGHFTMVWALGINTRTETGNAISIRFDIEATPATTTTVYIRQGTGTPDGGGGGTPLMIPEASFTFPYGNGNGGNGVTHTVNFNTHGGSAVAPQTGIPNGTAPTRPANPTHPSFGAFMDWYTDTTWTTPFSFTAIDNAVAQTLTAHARFANSPVGHVVTFDANGGTLAGGGATYSRSVPTTGATFANQFGLFNATTLTLADIGIPTRPGFVFRGWFPADQVNNPPENITGRVAGWHPISGPITMYARWLAEINVTFHGNGAFWDGSSSTVEMQVNEGDTFLYRFGPRVGDNPLAHRNTFQFMAIPVHPNPNAVFGGWFRTEQLANTPTGPNGNQGAIGPVHTITAQGALPTDNVWARWYLDGNGNGVTRTVTFHANNGSWNGRTEVVLDVPDGFLFSELFDEVRRELGLAPAEPIAPTTLPPGFIAPLIAWRTHATDTTADTFADAAAQLTVTQNWVFYAHFTPDGSGGNGPTPRTITFANAGGGAVPAVMSIDSGATTPAMPGQGTMTPPSGFIEPFLGWAVDGGIGNVAVADTFTMPDANLTATARWTTEPGGPDGPTVTFRFDETGIENTDLLERFDVDLATMTYVHEVVLGVPLIDQLPAAFTDTMNIYGDTDIPVNEHGYAFWGWFEGEDLVPVDRRDDVRRPLGLNDDGFDLEHVLTTDCLDADDNFTLFAVYVQWGDANDDGVVDLYDILLIEMRAFDLMLMGPPFYLPPEFDEPVVDRAIDVNLDGDIELYDIMYVEMRVFDLMLIGPPFYLDPEFGAILGNPTPMQHGQWWIS